ncbi:MAG: TldD/PmbA family protein [bacterium]|nr:TldD/PmbA family protein [bacterium]
MISDLERLDGLAAGLVDRADAAGVTLVWRAQSRAVRRVVVRRGKAESCSVTSVSGHGVQAVTPEGFVALGNRDDFVEEPALELLDRTVRMARSGETLGLERAGDAQWGPASTARAVPGFVDAFDDVDLSRVTRRLTELEDEIRGRVPGVNVVVSYKSELDAWRIVRNDGCDVLFAMPRCSLGFRATTDAEGSRHGVHASMFHDHPGLAWDDAVVSVFLRRAEHAARLALQLPDAPNHPAGSFPLVIDYALAKGLAHEAFGHSAEADGFRSSVLARDGRFRAGDDVGPDHVSIIDEPVTGDHAWQPFSANGIPRERAVIVDHGKLGDALSDPWSAGPGGVRLTGAGRAESFRSAPQPRMTNIRIEVDEPLPAPGAFEDYGPEEVRELLARAGVFERHPRVAFLSGYSGGQVNTAIGDFVFQCKAIYDLDANGIKMFKPAIFSGSMFGALQSVREAFGPLMLDAIGYCGKWGQSVPSSGGSHYFLVLDEHPDVRLGGS